MFLQPVETALPAASTAEASSAGETQNPAKLSKDAEETPGNDDSVLAETSASKEPSSRDQADTSASDQAPTENAEDSSVAPTTEVCEDESAQQPGQQQQSSPAQGVTDVSAMGR